MLLRNHELAVHLGPLFLPYEVNVLVHVANCIKACTQIVDSMNVHMHDVFQEKMQVYAIDEIQSIQITSQQINITQT